MTARATPSLLSRLFRRQLVLAWRRPQEAGNTLVFFAMVVALFPLGLGPAPDALARFAAGILWIIALLASLLAVDGLFRADHEDGSLEQLLLATQPLPLTVLAYLLSHWLVSGVLLALVSPLFALMLQLPARALPALVLGLLLGTGVLSVVGAIGAALTVGLRRGGLFVSLLILPFTMPVLIFGSALVDAAVRAQPVGPYLALLGAMLCLALALGPFAVAAGLRISADG